MWMMTVRIDEQSDADYYSCQSFEKRYRLPTRIRRMSLSGTATTDSTGAYELIAFIADGHILACQVTQSSRITTIGDEDESNNRNKDSSISMAKSESQSEMRHQLRSKMGKKGSFSAGQSMAETTVVSQASWSAADRSTEQANIPLPAVEQQQQPIPASLRTLSDQSQEKMKSELGSRTQIAQNLKLSSSSFSPLAESLNQENSFTSKNVVDESKMVPSKVGNGEQLQRKDVSFKKEDNKKEVPKSSSILTKAPLSFTNVEWRPGADQSLRQAATQPPMVAPALPVTGNKRATGDIMKLMNRFAAPAEIGKTNLKRQPVVSQAATKPRTIEKKESSSIRAEHETVADSLTKKVSDDKRTTYLASYTTSIEEHVDENKQDISAHPTISNIEKERTCSLECQTEIFMPKLAGSEMIEMNEQVDLVASNDDHAATPSPPPSQQSFTHPYEEVEENELVEKFLTSDVHTELVENEDESPPLLIMSLDVSGFDPNQLKLFLHGTNQLTVQAEINRLDGSNKTVAKKLMVPNIAMVDRLSSNVSECGTMKIIMPLNVSPDSDIADHCL